MIGRLPDHENQGGYRHQRGGPGQEAARISARPGESLFQDADDEERGWLFAGHGSTSGARA